MPILTNSERHIYKATHTTVELSRDGRQPSHAQEKAAFVRGLQLQSGEVLEVARQMSSAEGPRVSDRLVALLSNFEPHDRPGAARASALTEVAVESLKTFGEAVIDLRSRRLATIQSATVSRPETQLRANGEGYPPLWAGDQHVALSGVASQAAKAKSLIAFAQGSLDAFVEAIKVSPIGMLHLERIEMTPVGVERGELLGTVPLARRRLPVWGASVDVWEASSITTLALHDETR